MKQTKGYVYIIMILGALGGILYGYDIGVMNAAVIFINKEIVMSHGQESLLLGSVLGGGALATLFAGKVSDIIGRKVSILISCVIFILSTFIIMSSHGYESLLIGRLVQGIAVGIVTIVIPLYIVEVIPENLRGKGIALFQLMLTLGIVGAGYVGYLYTKWFPTNGHWRDMFGTSMVPAIFLLIGGAVFLPTSSRWLFMKGKAEKAKANLYKIYNENIVEHEYEKIKKSIAVGTTFQDFLAGFKNKKVVVLFISVALIAMLQQLTGINTFLQYSSSLLVKSGLTASTTAVFSSTVIMLINFVVTIIALCLIDYAGRRPLVLFGTFIVFLALILMAICYYFLGASSLKGYCMLTLLCLFIIGYAVGPGVCIWALLSEPLPNKMRSVGMSIALFLNSGMSFLYGSLFLPLSAHIGFAGLFLISAISVLIYHILIRKNIPETGNLSLEEIEDNLYKA
ncbi:MFS transporter [Francisella halioticida]|uniref:MFS transporter n=1 Tax=Francisella halioticida TaxID=549298 RepID=A0ABN5AVE8_9GAMM|nr:sugar porter family MFS transporter [Francisella halioticida]ASG67524.1 MFS transporter [Francisella halioticida]BCD90015.1 MFS transporter [Francisella halioticida]